MKDCVIKNPKSFPVMPTTLFLAKILVNLTMTLPAILISGVIFSLVFQLDAYYIAFSFIMPIAYAIFTALFGILINLNFPNFEWSSEAVVVKQSLASFIGIFGGMVFSSIPIVLLFVTGFYHVVPLLLFISVAVYAIDVVLFFIMKRWGVKTFFAL